VFLEELRGLRADPKPKFLPGYSPDFNRIERLWLRLKADWF
jgi:transposase